MVLFVCWLFVIDADFDNEEKDFVFNVVMPLGDSEFLLPVASLLLGSPGAEVM